MYVPQIIIESIVDTIINTRDFCGNETEAAIEAAFEAGLRGDDLKKAAGVNQKYIF